MTLEVIETVIRWAGGLEAFSTLGIVLFGIWRGTQRQVGRTTGLKGAWLGSPWFYLASTVIFSCLSILGWVRLPLSISQTVRIGMMVTGSLFYFPGMLFVLWGRLALGKNYFVSTGFGARLFQGHALVTDGPYAIVRHPMYAGLIACAVGAVLIYLTWTTILFICFAPLTLIRSRREETALAAEFGEQWQKYCRRVPRFFPRFILISNE
jgi:protein-S-isoprenylcysteine O-methyltransferase Ste14